MNWIIIAVLTVLAFLFLRVRHMKHKIYLVILILVLLFVYITASKVLVGQNINWKSATDIGKATKLYFSWLVDAGSNFKTIAGNAIKMDWKLNNSTATG